MKKRSSKKQKDEALKNGAAAAVAGNQIRLANLPDMGGIKSEVMELPELGNGPDGKAWEANINGLTVRDKSVLGQYLRAYGLHDTSGNAIISALCTTDDTGNLVFGETRAVAIEFCLNLPEVYLPMINRIASKAVALSAGKVFGGEQEVAAKVKN